MMNKLKTYSDKCLLDLLAQDSLAAFEEIYQRYWRLLYSCSYSRVRSCEISEELVQDVFTSLWEKRKVASIDNLSSYLNTAIKYKVINHFHREMSRRQYLQTRIETETVNTTEEEVLVEELNEALQREIQKLPAKRQQIFKLHREGNLSMKQVASHMGISEKTVENQLSKAIKVLRVSLKHFLML